MDSVSFDMKVWVSTVSVTPVAQEPILCPSCQEPLNLHQPEPEVPHRLMATCTCEESALWLVLVYMPDRSRVYMVRIPTMVEFCEKLARRGSDGHFPRFKG